MLNICIVTSFHFHLRNPFKKHNNNLAKALKYILALQISKPSLAARFHKVHYAVNGKTVCTTNQCVHNYDNTLK